MSIIKFSNFHFRYKGNEEYALNNINLEINKNQFILLAGETGSGKTTLIRCINGLIPQFYSGFYKGSVEIDGVKTTDTTISELSRKVGIVFQNPENQLISMNVLHELVFGPENLGFSKEEIQKRLGEVITLTGIENILDKPPFELSGGEQQRVALASILILKPQILILDEPTANLDPYFAKKILHLLKEIQKKEEITVIISEHRMDLILSLIDDIILMNEGKVILFNSKENVVNSPEFKQINVNKPTIYSIFSELKKKGLFHQNIPVSISSAIKSLQELQR
jgi:energy-coupling factor transporter ATP-binding protein EcfA2